MVLDYDHDDRVCAFAEIEAMFSIADVPRSDMLIVGDSLTSDMRGGIAAGSSTCWYNPARLPRPQAMAIDFEIQDLHQVLSLL